VDQAARAGGQEPELAGSLPLGASVRHDGGKTPTKAEGEDTMTSREDIEHTLRDEDGRIKLFYEFCDTALAARMMQG
jgi:hypothetical protein